MYYSSCAKLIVSKCDGRIPYQMCSRGVSSGAFGHAVDNGLLKPSVDSLRHTICVCEGFV